MSAQTAAAAETPSRETLLGDLEELGLNGSQARVLLAIIELGTSGSSEIARVAGVPRTAVYPLLQELAVKRLVAQVGSGGPATWACAGRQEVLDRLDAAQEERIARQRERAVRVRLGLEAMFPAAPSTTPPFVHVLPGLAQVKEAYHQLLSETATELLVLSGPPYTSYGPMNTHVVGLLERGVKIRVLFDPARDAASRAQRRRDVRAYKEAGVEARVLGDLPVKLVISDREAVLAAIPDPASPDTGFPTSLLVRSTRFAGVQATAFESYWAAGRPAEP